MNMIGCLYRNVYGPFFEIFKDTIEYEYGPLIGYGINLSKESNIKLFKDKIPLYLINKLQPFLENSIQATGIFYSLSFFLLSFKKNK